MTDFVRFILILYSSIFEKHAPQSIRFAYDSLSISRHDTRIFTAVVRGLLGTFVNNYHGVAMTTTNEAWADEIRIMQEVLQPWKD